MASRVLVQPPQSSDYTSWALEYRAVAVLPSQTR
jgi:hypothetical protein